MSYPYIYPSYTPIPYSSPYAQWGVSVPMYPALYLPHPLTPPPQRTGLSKPNASVPQKVSQQASRPRIYPRHVHFPNPTKDHKPDLLEETPIRYLGFTDEFGESWASVIRYYTPKYGKAIYNWSYRITGLYAAADALHKGYEAYKHHQEGPNGERWKAAFAQAAKTGLFQALASYMAPLFIIKNVRLWMEKGIRRLPVNHPLLPKGSLGRLYLPAVACTVLLPIIAHPIDTLVHGALDWSFRKLGWDKYATFRNDAGGS